ncbi:hypothetical protein [Compostimonas suwonensis]|uniref:hypothetical protein n=1 Tax=Compostimonas suwonensis TaxID=1048394 RepID=UPI0012FD925D|nr:hypothetical protein [Compostimonas suwonensis]
MSNPAEGRRGVHHVSNERWAALKYEMVARIQLQAARKAAASRHAAGAVGGPVDDEEG